MRAPQIILIATYGMSLLLNAYAHGKPKSGKNNFWTALVNAAIIFSLLTWGGFFNG